MLKRLHLTVVFTQAIFISRLHMSVLVMNPMVMQIVHLNLLVQELRGFLKLKVPHRVVLLGIPLLSFWV